MQQNTVAMCCVDDRTQQLMPSQSYVQLAEVLCAPSLPVTSWS